MDSRPAKRLHHAAANRALPEKVGIRLDRGRMLVFIEKNEGSRVLTINKSGGKPDIAYPCSWGYKVIGSDVELLRSAIAQVIQERPHTVTPSNRSLTGKYRCLDVEIIVTSEECRLEIYEGLRKHPAVKVVL
jgi:putative lipoic acid-binding regulatory protein